MIYVEPYDPATYRWETHLEILPEGFRKCEHCAFWIRASGMEEWPLCATCAEEQRARDQAVEDNPRGHCARCQQPIDAERATEVEEDEEPECYSCERASWIRECC